MYILYQFIAIHSFIRGMNSHVQICVHGSTHLCFLGKGDINCGQGRKKTNQRNKQTNKIK